MGNIYKLKELVAKYPNKTVVEVINKEKEKKG